MRVFFPHQTEVIVQGKIKSWAGPFAKEKLLSGLSPEELLSSIGVNHCFGNTPLKWMELSQ